MTNKAKTKLDTILERLASVETRLDFGDTIIKQFDGINKAIILIGERQQTHLKFHRAINTALITVVCGLAVTGIGYYVFH